MVDNLAMHARRLQRATHILAQAPATTASAAGLGDDTIFAGAGIDTVAGGAGNDIASLARLANDVLNGGDWQRHRLRRRRQRQHLEGDLGATTASRGGIGGDDPWRRWRGR